MSHKQTTRTRNYITRTKHERKSVRYYIKQNDASEYSLVEKLILRKPYSKRALAFRKKESDLAAAHECAALAYWEMS